MTDRHSATLMRLRDTGRTVADPREDIRGRHVKDAAGSDIGTVDDLLIDQDEHKVRFLRVEHGGILGFGATPSFVPVEVITQITEDDVHVGTSREQIAQAPRYDPELADQGDYYTALYGYYGYAPFWGATPMDPRVMDPQYRDR